MIILNILDMEKNNVYLLAPSSGTRSKIHRIDGCSIVSKAFEKDFSFAHGKQLPLSVIKKKQLPLYIRHHFKGAENIGDII